LCTSACTTFTSCGVTTKSTCVSDCASASASFRTCIGAAGTDCNALAVCYFKATAASDCTAGGGVPAGTATCAATDSCEGTCNTNSSGPACRCACLAAADPSVANLVLGINSCASDTCASACNGTSGPDCNTCFDTQCGTPRTACLAH
ncbi:MAG TPA: hypothetical protein VHO06_24365, partial [Polyangia bacterium]|nr:hypothetical protein [Polyangia bacterium]